MLSNDGKRELRDYLLDTVWLMISGSVHYLDWSKVVEDECKGENVKTLPKRLSQRFYKEYQIKLTPQQMSQIGNICQKYIVC